MNRAACSRQIVQRYNGYRKLLTDAVVVSAARSGLLNLQTKPYKSEGPESHPEPEARVPAARVNRVDALPGGPHVGRFLSLWPHGLKGYRPASLEPHPGSANPLTSCWLRVWIRIKSEYLPR